MVAFLKVACVDIAHDGDQVLGVFAGIGGQLMGFFGRFETGGIQDIEQQDGVISNGGASGFGDDVRVRDVLGRERFRHGFYHVHAVFIERIVAAGGVVGVGTVVIDSETAAEVEIPHGSAFLNQAGINAAGFEHAGADVADVRDLGTDMVMEQTEAVEHVRGFEFIDDMDEFGGIEPEDAAVAAGFGPLSACAGGKFHADADHGFDLELAAAFDDGGDFTGHFHDHDALDAEFGCIKREVDEFFILVAVADETSLMVGHGSDGGDEFGFAAGFETVVEFASEAGDFLHHLLLLIDLDRINAAVLALESGLFDGFGTSRMQKPDLGVQNISQTEQNGHIHAAFLDPVHDLHQADRRPILAERGDGQFAFSVDVEIIRTPVADAVKVGGIPRSPMFKCFFSNIHFTSKSSNKSLI